MAFSAGGLADWAFACQHALEKVVQEKFPEEAHRWPVLRVFNAEGFIWKNDFLIVILRNKMSGVPSMGDPKPIEESEFPLDEPNLNNIQEWQDLMIKKFSVVSQDFVIIFPIKPGKTIDEKWKLFDENEKQVWHIQMSVNVTRQYYNLKGFDLKGDFFIPPGYLHLDEECQQFMKDNPNFEKNIFVMMKFDDNEKLKKLETRLRSFLKEKGYNPLRADDKVYQKDRDLWGNVCVYMICCKQGISILENIAKPEYNPNVAIEYGFMRALDKRVLLLADKDFPTDRADIVGKIRETFDIGEVDTIKSPIDKWIKEL